MPSSALLKFLLAGEAGCVASFVFAAVAVLTMPHFGQGDFDKEINKHTGLYTVRLMLLVMFAVVGAVYFALGWVWP